MLKKAGKAMFGPTACTVIEWALLSSTKVCETCLRTGPPTCWVTKLGQAVQIPTLLVRNCCVTVPSQPVFMSLSAWR